MLARQASSGSSSLHPLALTPCKRRVRIGRRAQATSSDNDEDENGMSYWARWMAKTAEKEGKKVQPMVTVQPPPPSSSSRSASPAPESANVASVTQARPLDFSWWGSLPRAHYITFGPRIGILPIVELPPSDGLAVALSSSQNTGFLPAVMAAYAEKSTSCLVAFEDRSDAEFVAATLRANLEATLMASGEGNEDEVLRETTASVLSSSPLFLKDVAGTRSAVLGVIPRDVISHSVQLSDLALQELLAQILLSESSLKVPQDVSNVKDSKEIDGNVPQSSILLSMPAPDAFTQRSSASMSKQSNIKFEFSGFKSPPTSKISNGKQKEIEVKKAGQEDRVEHEDQKVKTDSKPSDPPPPIPITPEPSALEPSAMESDDYESQLRILDALDEKAREMQEREQDKQMGSSSYQEDMSDEIDIETASRLPPTNKLFAKLLEQSMSPVQSQRREKTTTKVGSVNTPPLKPLDQGRRFVNEPLKEDEKDALLSEWYSLSSKMKKKKSPAADKAGPSSLPQAAKASKPQEPEIMPDSTSSSISREEEDAYVNAVLQNLEVVAGKVREAERRTAEAGRRAKAGDSAAAMAKASADSQLDALREQLEQLVFLRDSLKGLKMEEEEMERRKEKGDTSENFVQAEIVDPPSPSPLSEPSLPSSASQPLPTPAVITPRPSDRAVEDKGSNWGSSWGRNRRIQAAGVSLLSTAPGGNTRSHPTPNAPIEKTADAASSLRIKPSSPSPPTPSPTTASNQEEDGLVSIVSKRAGKARAPKVQRTPEEKQAIVKDALRFAAMTEPEGEGTQETESGGAWWKTRFQALWLPTLLYADGSLGFVQIDVSLAEGRKDVRVIAFEDRNDATCCMAVLKQWPEYDWVDMSVSCLPTSTIEESIQRAFTEQAENEVKGVSPPSGLCVFRRGKLAMKVGMTMEELESSVVYQAAAQKSLSRIGFAFDE